jgi:hypothetical protein
MEIPKKTNIFWGIMIPQKNVGDVKQSLLFYWPLILSISA